MLKRFSWKENDIYIIQLKEDLYTIAQLLAKPHVAFFNITSERNDFSEKSIDLNAVEPFGVCMVLKGFIKTASIEKTKNIYPNRHIPIPEIFISKDREQWGNPKISDDKKTYNLVRIDPNIGDQGIMGNEIIQYNINRKAKKNPKFLSKYELTGYNMGYGLVRRLILSFENNRWIDPEKELRLLGVDNYPLKTIEEMWDYGVPRYEIEQEQKQPATEKTKDGFNYLSDMYDDPYFPRFLVDKVKSSITKVVRFLEEGSHAKEEIQEKLDKMTLEINELQEEFDQNGREIETAARESIGQTVEEILQYFKIDIEVEEAIRKRDW